jgi:predicted CopG family antitoxin
MKNIMIRDGIYEKLKEMKDRDSFSDIIEELVHSSIETRRRELRSFFGALSDKEAKEFEKAVSEVLRVAKGRLF